MKTGEHRYKYIKLVDGKVQYGEVVIEVNFIHGASIVLDNCSWITLKQSHANFEELSILKIWKLSAIKAAESVVEKYFPNRIEIKIKDIVGIYVDTVPSNIGAAVTIGIFDLLESPLNTRDIRILDNFVIRNNQIDLVPDYKKCIRQLSKT